MTPISRGAPLLAPFVTFMLFLVIDGYFPDQHYLLYPVKTIAVAGVIAWFWRRLPSLQPRWILASAGIGVGGVIIWIGADPWAIRLNGALVEAAHRLFGWQLTNSAVANVPHPAGRDPFQLYPPAEAWLLFAFRAAGIALVVPVMEELFWRGFLMRWLIREDFETVPLGTYQPASFWITTACFASVHGSEWLLAVLVGVIYGAWFVRTKSLGDIMLAHGVTNFLLAAYCLVSGDWHFLAPMAASAPPK